MFLNIKYIPIILLSLIINFGINYLFRNLEKLLLRKSILLFGVMFNIGVLLYFKYFNFFIGNINLLFSQSFNLKTLIIPIGISFFTFQQISYIIDSYYGKILKCSLLDYSLYVMFFPKIIQGPIVKYNDLATSALRTSEAPPGKTDFTKI
jgi:alginate O-acetyltransferase complex protein AlgI